MGAHKSSWEIVREVVTARERAWEIMGVRGRAWAVGPEHRVPRLGHRGELAVGRVEGAAMQVQRELGRVAQEKVGDEGGRRVVRAVPACMRSTRRARRAVEGAMETGLWKGGCGNGCGNGAWKATMQSVGSYGSAGPAPSSRHHDAIMQSAGSYRKRWPGSIES